MFLVRTFLCFTHEERQQSKNDQYQIKEHKICYNFIYSTSEYDMTPRMLDSVKKGLSNTRITVCLSDSESKFLNTPPTLTASSPAPSQFTLRYAKLLWVPSDIRFGARLRNLYNIFLPTKHSWSVTSCQPTIYHQYSKQIKPSNTLYQYTTLSLLYLFT